MREHGHTQPLDTYELLSTKLALPRPRPSLMPREPLFARLDEGLQHKLTLLSAPAGFGKTTLVSEWIAARSERQEPLAVAWTSKFGKQKVGRMTGAVGSMFMSSLTQHEGGLFLIVFLQVVGPF